jgi:NitT/TauT family transport system ATP-binding protein
MNACISFRSIDKAFVNPRNSRHEQIFKQFSMEIAEGELVAVVGASGTGKTTLLNIVAGLEQPDSGSVVIGDGLEVPRLAVVFQQPRLLDWLSVEKNVSLAVRSAGLDTRNVAKVLDKVGLHEHIGAFASMLSGGQRQRVAVARAFAIEPDLVLLDEPFSALDELTARRLRLLLQDLWIDRPRTGLLVTHNALEAAFLADRVIVLAGRPAEVAHEYRIVASRPRSPEDPDLFAFHTRIVADLV